jgi:membrane-associated phospholipid phosphatase
MKDIILKNKVFFIPYSVLMLLGVFFLIHFTKAEIHLYINQFHHPYFDFFFRNLTYMGDGIFLPVYLIIMIMIRFRYAVLLIVVFLISGLVVQILKRTVFSDIVRPVEYFKNYSDLYFVPGVKQNCCNSFPSGHSATAFGIMVTFIFAINTKWTKSLLLLLACLIAFSRVYLSQHFIIDIMAGSFIGTLTALFFSMWVDKWKILWLDQNVFNIKKEKINFSKYD